MKELLKFPTSSSNGVFCISIASLDAAIANMIDALQSSFDHYGHFGNRAENTKKNVKAPTCRASQRNVPTTGESSLQKVDVVFKILLPLATEQMLLGFLSIPCERAGEDLQQWELESSTGLSGDEQERLRHNKKVSTVAFNYSVSGHYYIAIILSSFQCYECRWIETVSDYYVFQTNSLGKPAALFFVHDDHDEHHDRDEEKKPEPAKKEDLIQIQVKSSTPLMPRRTKWKVKMADRTRSNREASLPGHTIGLIKGPHICRHRRSKELSSDSILSECLPIVPRCTSKPTLHVCYTWLKYLYLSILWSLFPATCFWKIHFNFSRLSMSLSATKQMNYIIDHETLCRDTDFTNSFSKSVVDTTDKLSEDLSNFLDDSVFSTSSSFYHSIENERHPLAGVIPCKRTHGSVCLIVQCVL